MTDILSGAAAPTAPAGANKLYFAAWRWHFYAGLYVVPFFLLLAVTGAMMVWFSAVAPEYGERSTIATREAPLSLRAQMLAASEAIPDGVVTKYIAPLGPENPALFGLATEDGPQMVTVNPYSGAILQTRREGDTWEEFADRLHGELMMKGEAKFWGDLLVEMAASLGLLLLVSGLFMAWPRAGRSLRAMLVPDLGARGRGLWKSLHLVTGTWLSLVLVFFLISGLSWAGIWGGRFVQAWSTFPAEKWDAVPLSDATHASLNHTAREEVPWALEQTPLPESGSAAGVTGVPEGQPVTLESVAGLARSLGFDARFQLAFPAGETGVWTISRDSMSADSTDPTSDRTVHVDRYTGKVLADVGYDDYSAAGKAMAVGVALHMGLMGGWNVALNLALCVALAFLAVSGVVMWWKRRPEGARLGAPPRPAEVPLSRGAIVATLALALAFPVLGLTLLAVAVLDLLVIGPLPALRRALS